jgi:DNA replication ATP-dependent helicase Dna2
VGQPSRIHNDILPYCAEVLGKSFAGDVAQLKQLFNSKQVVASTCLGINHPAIAGKTFDYCIFDEAGEINFLLNCFRFCFSFYVSNLGQSMMLSTVGPLFYCRKFVLVGDPEQLPPVVQSSEARKKGLEASLFAHLVSEFSINFISSIKHTFSPFSRNLQKMLFHLPFSIV